MRRGIPLAGLAVALAFVLSASAAPTDPKKDPDKTDPKEKLVAAGVFTGKMGQVEGTSKWFTVQVPKRIPVQNPGALANIINLKAQLVNYQAQLANQQGQLLNAIKNKDAAGANNVRNAIANTQNALAATQIELQRNQAIAVTYQEKTYDIELQAAEDMKVRLLQPPVAFDDNGKPKKYTKKELDELKGPDKKLPGYTAAFENLRPGQVVEVYLAKKKDSSKPSVKDPDKDTKSDNRPFVTMIVIQREPPK
jgi:hypothetical protein